MLSELAPFPHPFLCLSLFHSCWPPCSSRPHCLPALLNSLYIIIYLGFPGGSVIKNLPVNAEDAGDTGSIPGSERSPGGAIATHSSIFCLGNSVDRGAWRATVHGVVKSQTQLITYIHVIYLPTNTYLSVYLSIHLSI